MAKKGSAWNPKLIRTAVSIVSNRNVPKVEVAKTVSKPVPKSPMPKKTSKAKTRKLVSLVLANAATAALNNLMEKPVEKMNSRSQSKDNILDQFESLKKEKLFQNYSLIIFGSKMEENEEKLTKIRRSVGRWMRTVEFFSSEEKFVEALKENRRENPIVLVFNEKEKNFSDRFKLDPSLEKIFVEFRRTSIETIENLILKSIERVENNTIRIFSSKNVEKFVLMEFFKEILTDNNSRYQGSAREFSTFWKFFYLENRWALDEFAEFSADYHLHTPLCWLKRTHFVFSLLDRSIFHSRIDLLFRLAFLVHDLHHDIEETFNEKSNENPTENFTVFRAMILPKSFLEQISVEQRTFLSFDNFISATESQQDAIDLLPAHFDRHRHIEVIFRIQIEPTTPFVFLQREKQNRRVLLSIKNVFCFQQIEQQQRFSLIDLTIVQSDDETFNNFMETFRNDFQHLQGWHRLGGYFCKIGEFGRSEEVYLSMINGTSDEIQKADLFDKIGDLYAEQKNIERSMKFYKIVLSLRRKNLTAKHPDLAKILKKIGEIYGGTSNFVAAKEIYSEIYEMERDVLTNEDYELAKTCSKFGFYLMKTNENSRALELFEKSLQVVNFLAPTNLDEIFELSKQICTVLFSLKDFQRALTVGQEALNIVKSIEPINEERLNEIYKLLASINLGLCRFPRSLHFYEKALPFYLKNPQENEPTIIDFYSNIAFIQENTDKADEALKNYQKLIEFVQEKNDEKSNRIRADFLQKIANLHRKNSRFDEALHFADLCFQVKSKFLDETNLDLAMILHFIAEIQRDRKDFLAAKTFYEKAFNIASASLKPEDPELDFFKKPLENTENQ